MLNVGVAFEILDNERSLPVGWSRTSGHIIFDVKMDFTRKARWVLDGHRILNPSYPTFVSVVSRESIRISLTYAVLNGLNIYAADIQSVYLQAPSSEKYYIIYRKEFGLEKYSQACSHLACLLWEQICRKRFSQPSPRMHGFS